MNIIEQSYRETHDTPVEDMVTDQQLYFYLNSLPLISEGQVASIESPVYGSIEAVESMVKVMGRDVVYLRPTNAKEFDPVAFVVKEHVMVIPIHEETIEKEAAVETEYEEVVEETKDKQELFNPKPYHSTNNETSEEEVKVETEVEDKDTDAPLQDMEEFLSQFIQDRNGSLIPIHLVPKKSRDMDKIVKTVAPMAIEISEKINNFKEALDEMFEALEETYPEFKEFKRSYSIKTFSNDMKIVKQKENYRFYKDGKMMPISLN